MQTIATPSPTLSVSSDSGTPSISSTLIATSFPCKDSQPIGPHFYNLPRRTRRPAPARSLSSSSSSENTNSIGTSRAPEHHSFPIVVTRPVQQRPIPAVFPTPTPTLAPKGYIQPHIAHLPRRRPLTASQRAAQHRAEAERRCALQEIVPASGLYLALSDDIDEEILASFTSVIDIRTQPSRSASLVLTLPTTDCEQGTPQLTRSQLWDGLAFLHAHHVPDTGRTLVTTPSSHTASGLALAAAFFVSLPVAPVNLCALGELEGVPWEEEEEGMADGQYTRTHLFVMALHDLDSETGTLLRDVWRGVLSREGMWWVQRAVCGWEGRNTRS